MTVVALPTKSKFFEYNQNNSGGEFVLDETRGITHYVIIEALNSGQADSLAEEIGLYFDGEGDCPCCGDRWYPSYGDGTDIPTIYGEDVEAKVSIMAWMPPGKEIVVHYLDGRKVWHGVFTKS